MTVRTTGDRADRTRLIDRRYVDTGNALDQQVRNRGGWEASRSGGSALCRIPGMLVAGCAPAPAPQPTPAPAVAQPQAVAPAEHAGNPPRFVTGIWRYDITAVGFVSDPADTTGRQDTVVTNTTLAYDTRSRIPVGVSGEMHLACHVDGRHAAQRHDSWTGPPSGPRLIPHRALSRWRRFCRDACALRGRDPSTDQARKLATTPKIFCCLRHLARGGDRQLMPWRASLVSRSTRDYTVAPQSGTDHPSSRRPC